VGGPSSFSIAHSSGVTAFSSAAGEVKPTLPSPSCVIMSQAGQGPSPRRIKVAHVTVLFELRAVRSLPPSAFLARLESKVRSWRGLQRWTMQAYMSSRGESVVQLIVEKPTQSVRIDNLFSSWRRVLMLALRLNTGTEAVRKSWRRASWISSDGQHGTSSWYADARVLAEPYEAACMKVWDEVRRSEGGAVRCSHLEPAIPEPQRQRQPEVNAALRSSHGAPGGCAVGVVGQAVGAAALPPRVRGKE